MGEDHLERLLLVDDQTGDKEEIDASHLFIFIGAEPRTDWLPDRVQLDEDGFVVTGPDLLVDGKRPAGLDARPRALPAGVEPAGRLRRRRRALAVGQAGRLGRR